MRIRSQKWEKIARHGHFAFQAKARINGKDYKEITAPDIERGLLSDPLGVGSCNAACLTFTLRTEDEIPTGGKVVIMGRLLDENMSGEIVTEWKEFGTFFIDQRETSYYGLTKLECYDAMLKTNQQLARDGDSWPRSMKEVVEEIAERIGVGIDLRTKIRIGNSYVVPNPEDKTMNEVLGYIGACHGGNWIITEDNLLRLVPLITAPEETFYIIDDDYRHIVTGEGHTLIYKEKETFHAVLPAPSGETPDSRIHQTYYITDDYGRRVVTPEGYYLIYDTEDHAVRPYIDDTLLNIPGVIGSIDTGPLLTVTGVRMTDEEGTEFEAGNDTGVTLTVESNPYACQAICDDLFQAYGGLVYLPFSVTRAVYDPCLELGDQVVIGDRVRGVVYREHLTMDFGFRGDLEAPNNKELNAEYPYLSQEKQLQVVKKQVKKTASEVETVKADIKKTDESIRLEVIRAKGAENILATSIELTDGRITSEITRASGAESAIRQTVESISFSVTNNGTSSTLSLTRDGVVVESEVISFSGLVKFSNLTDGTTTISGDNVTTGTLNANLVKLEGHGGGFTSAVGYDGTQQTEGAMMYGSDHNYYFIATNKGVRMTANGTSLYCTATSIRASTPIEEGSDKNLKNTITYDLGRYRDFFMSLQPAFYKFNDGTSGRFHTGFVAQQVEAALRKNNLGNKDFAGLTVATLEDPRPPFCTTTRYALRYTEFVSLNTYMIQQALREIEALKVKIQRLEGSL